MTEWCPVAESDAVAKGPVHVELAADDIVVFKPATGAAAALQAHCLHRGMLLSCGTVHDDVITCPYHGWSFDRHGRGTTAAGHDRGQCAVSYDTHEAFGLVWVRSPGGSGEFPATGLPLVGSVVTWFLRRAVRSVRGFRRSSEKSSG